MKIQQTICMIFLSVFMVLLAGCVSMQHNLATAKGLPIAPGVVMPLPKLSTLDLHLTASQLLTAHYGKKAITSQVQVEINSHKLVMVAFGGWGGEVFSINYNGKQIKSSHLPMPHAAVGVQSVLRDFLLTYTPLGKLQKLLQSQDITVVQTGRVRKLQVAGKTIIKIVYAHANPWQGSVRLYNYLRHYKINITTLSMQQQEN